MVLNFMIPDLKKNRWLERNVMSGKKQEEAEQKDKMNVKTESGEEPTMEKSRGRRCGIYTPRMRSECCAAPAQFPWSYDAPVNSTPLSITSTGWATVWARV